MAFLSALGFVAAIAVLVLLSGPPRVIVAIIAVVVVGLLLGALTPPRVTARAKRAKTRAAAHQFLSTTPDPTGQEG